jgi:hypothetical protein
METAAHGRRPRSTWIAVACALGATAIVLAGGLHAALSQDAVRPLPQRLSETGLFRGQGELEVDPGNVPFAPQYPLWTDGAAKRRWVRLPEGSAIDATDPDAWQFPVGTRFWKEFSFGGRPVETRYLERLPDGSFRFASYVWAADGRDALLAPAGETRTVRTASGQLHDVPRESDCRACHEGRSGRVLGFNALQLSSDRDPNAPHREALPNGAIDLRGLVARGLITGLPESVVRTPPRIASESPRERAALGYLYGNCSGCHNASSSIAALGLDLDQSVVSDRQAALRTTVSVPSAFAVPSVTGQTHRIAPGESDASALAYRMSSRFAATQMPPLGTRLVDDEALELVRNWISKDLTEVGKEDK